MEYKVKIDAFEGPIDLLLHLLKKDKVEIYDIKISQITGQYLDYIATMQRLDLEVASQFLVMAAKLIEIKADNLLPKPKEDNDEEEVDPRQELVNRLLEYKKYKELASRLREFEHQQRKSYTRNVAPLLANLNFEEDNPLESIELDDFVLAFKNVLAQKESEVRDDKEDKREELPQLVPEEVTIKEQEGYIMQKLLATKGQITFLELFSKVGSRLEIIVTFMALLELIKLQEIRVRQDNNFEQIIIYHVGSGGNVERS